MITKKDGGMFGLSTDIKPTEGVANSEFFHEMDTEKTFLFDEENKRWLEQRKT